MSYASCFWLDRSNEIRKNLNRQTVLDLQGYFPKRRQLSRQTSHCCIKPSCRVSSPWYLSRLRKKIFVRLSSVNCQYAFDVYRQILQWFYGLPNEQVPEVATSSKRIDLKRIYGTWLHSFSLLKPDPLLFLINVFFCNCQTLKNAKKRSSCAGKWRLRAASRSLFFWPERIAQPPHCKNAINL